MELIVVQLLAGIIGIVTSGVLNSYYFIKKVNVSNEENKFKNQCRFLEISAFFHKKNEIYNTLFKRVSLIDVMYRDIWETSAYCNPKEYDMKSKSLEKELKTFKIELFEG